MIVCIAGTFVALELKRDSKEKLKPIQEYTLNEIRKAGGVSLAACPENWEEILINLTHLKSPSRLALEHMSSSTQEKGFPQ